MILTDATLGVGDVDRNDELHQSAHALVEGVRTGSLGPALITDFIIDGVVTIWGGGGIWRREGERCGIEPPGISKVDLRLHR